MIAVLENDKSLAQLFLALGLFVVTAVPRAIRKRRKRIAWRLLNGSDCRNLLVT